MDMGDFVIVINAEKIAMSGNEINQLFTAAEQKWGKQTGE
jgi:ribosomal protein L13